MNVQLPLGISLPESAVFSNYLEGNNSVALGLCRQLAEGLGDKQVLLWGEPGLGKTHLLQASCTAAAQKNIPVTYLPLREVLSYGPDVLEGLEKLGLVCIDDIHLCAGSPEWEQAAFNLINRCRAAQTQLLISSNNVPSESGFQLADLLSRLGWGAVVQLRSLDDDEKVIWLQQRSQRQGLEMSEDVALYMLKHCPRDMHSLGQLLDKLDKASMAAQRRLTIPFLKEILI